MSYVHLLWQRILLDPFAFIAIVLGAFGIWRAENLFTKLDKNLNALIDGMKKNMLDEMLVVTKSYAAFSEALRDLEPDSKGLPQDAYFALLTTFHFTGLRYPDLKGEAFETHRKLITESAHKDALEYRKMFIDNGYGKLKE